MSDDDAVPPAARLVRDFVNTCQLDIDWEVWTTPDGLRDWFVERGLVPSDAAMRPSDVTTAVTIREGLREALLGNAGHATDRKALENLDRALAGVPVRMSLATGGPRLVADEGPAGERPEPFHQALVGLLDAIRQCAEDHTWARLKVCDKESCRWAYYDASRNRVRRWCSMAECGNKVKMRRAYARRSAHNRS